LWIPRLDAGERVQAGVISLLLAFVVIVLPQLLSGYWITVCTSVAIYAIVALGLGILMGRTGLVSLGQIALLALAAWVGARLFFATGLQRGAVTVTTAAVVVGETIVPAAVGVVALGDQIRPGFVPVAVAGFVVALTGALLLTRFGEPVEQMAAAGDTG